MTEFEISDIIFFVKSVKQPSIHFRISDFITFSSSRTRSSTYLKLRHSTAKNNALHHCYFYRLPRLWNSLPCIDTDLPISTIRVKLNTFFWSHFVMNFSHDNLCTFHFLCPCNNCSKLPVSLQFSPSVL